MNLDRADPDDYCFLTDLRVSGDMGTGTGGVVVDILDGNFSTGYLSGTVTINSVASVQPGDLWSVRVGFPLTGRLEFLGDARRKITMERGIDPNGVIEIGTGPNGGDLEADLQVRQFQEYQYMKGAVMVHGDVTGSIDVEGELTATGSIIVDGDVLDGGDNHVWIERMTGGHFECNNLATKNEVLGEDSEYFVLGRGQTVGTLQTGSIAINGVLSGSLYLRTQTEVDVFVNILASDPDPGHPAVPYGGILSFGGFTETSKIEVNEFRQGVIHRLAYYVPNESVDGMLGTIQINGDLGDPNNDPNNVAGILAWYSMDPNAFDTRAMDLGATITIDGDVYPSADDPNHPEVQSVFATGNLTGQIRVNGSLFDDGDPNDPEIEILGTIDANSGAAVAIDYDGWHEGDDWATTGATIEVGGTPYDENAPALRLWEISDCRGDLDNDYDVDATDLNLFDTALDDAPQYALDWPGLAGSREWHGDVNGDGSFDASDKARIENIVAAGGCCFTNWETCPEDLDDDGAVAPESGGGSAAATSWNAVSTFGAARGDYAFDLTLQLTGTGDAWTSSGATLTAHNGAAFTLAATPTTQNSSATFVCSPRALTAELPASVEIAGSYSPADANEVYETDQISIVWYDRDASTIGSGAIMRLVIDASGVTNGGSEVDVSSVYFSQSGPARAGDILIVSVASETSTLLGGANTAVLNGAFYATE